MAGFIERTNNGFQKSIGKFLKSLSSFGMVYDDMVIKQSRAIGISEDKFGWKFDPKGVAGGDYDDYALFANLSLSDTSLRKNISFFDKSYPKKRDELRKFAVQDEIEDILDIICDESIVFDEKTYFCEPYLEDADTLKPDVLEKVNASMLSSFKKLYQYFGFNNDISAWSSFRKWLIDGYIAYEIIYDESQKNIIGFKEVDPVSLQPGLDKDGQRMWTQFKGDPKKERSLHDSQIIYLSYSQINTDGRISYVERLVRAFNLLRIMEHTRIIWAVVNASFKTKFVIPVTGKSKIRAAQSMNVLMQKYREEIDFDASSGELKVNGRAMLPFNKEYWFPEGSSGEPKIETIGNDGPDLSDMDAVKYFRNNLIKVSKIPATRMDASSPVNWEVNAESTQRDEIRFSRFINRLRTTFQEILMKPLWIQLCLQYPDLKDDASFKSLIGIKYHKYNFFDEMMEIEVLSKRLDFVERMKNGLVDTDANMVERKYFSNEFLIKRWMKFNQDDINENQRFKKKEDKEMKEFSKENQEAGLGGMGGFGGGFGGNDTDLGSDIDKELKDIDSENEQ